MNMRSRRYILTRAMAAIVAMAYGLRMAPAARAPQRLPKQHHVKIRGFSFTPKLIKVMPGDTVIWTNHDIAPHTASAKDKSWDTGTITRGKSKKIVVTEGFAPDYLCRFHPMMRAKLHIILEE